MVRLFTHNLLACHAKSCVGAPAAFPLAFKDVTIAVREAEFNADFLRGFMSRLEWGALVSAAKQVCVLIILKKEYHADP
jgi:multifunctional methyltransferase subunit TRM112